MLAECYPSRVTHGRFALVSALLLAACNACDSRNVEPDAGAVVTAPPATTTTPTSTTTTTGRTPPPRLPPKDAAIDARKLSPSFVYKDINHVLGTGQSLSVGSQG